MVHKIAVTGVGGASGQGILKALLSWNPTLEIYPVDVTPISPGLYWPGCMPGTVLPKPEQDIDAWKRWAAETGINLIIPGADRDLPPLAAVAQDWKREHICRIAVSSEKMIDAANDKWKTVKALREVGLDAPDSHAAPNTHGVLTEWVNLRRYPLIVKPRMDAASRGLNTAHDEEELLFYWNRASADPIVQEYLEGDEYTCALFFDIDHELCAQFAMKRWLYAGSTYRAEVIGEDDHPALHEFLRKFGRVIRTYNPFGPINIQLKDVPGRGPVVFEINARCSGSSVIRAHFGYNEPAMLVKHMLDRLPVDQPRTRKGFAFRYFEELYLDGQNERDVKAYGAGEAVKL